MVRQAMFCSLSIFSEGAFSIVVVVVVIIIVIVIVIVIVVKEMSLATLFLLESLGLPFKSRA